MKILEFDFNTQRPHGTKLRFHLHFQPFCIAKHDNLWHHGSCTSTYGRWRIRHPWQPTFIGLADEGRSLIGLVDEG